MPQYVFQDHSTITKFQEIVLAGRYIINHDIIYQTITTSPNAKRMVYDQSAATTDKNREIIIDFSEFNDRAAKKTDSSSSM
jgi:hypothetical protein